jgi:Ser/Thr protein kinase RdoA (MazF antagonist)
VGEYTRFLAERTGDAEHLRQVREEWRRLAERHLPERLRTCVGHGDFAPRNIFNRAPDGVTGFDMVTEWRAPVLEDVAHFLLSLSVHGPRARLLSPARIADLRSAFLRGYFGTESVPSGELACVGVLVLLDKWAAAVARGGGPGDDGARSRAFRRDLATVLGGGLAGREQPVRT